MRKLIQTQGCWLSCIKLAFSVVAVYQGLYSVQGPRPAGQPKLKSWLWYFSWLVHLGGNRFVFVRVCFHMCGSEMIAASPHSGCWGKALVFSIHHTLRMKSAWWESCREAAVILKILIRLSPLEPCGPRVALKHTHKRLLVSLSIL